MRPDEQADLEAADGNGPMSRAAAAAIIAVLVLSAALRFPWLASDRLWYDEIFSVTTAIQDLPELWRRVLDDETNPPGFYLLLAGWIRLGDLSEAWLRTLPAIAGVLTPVATIAAGRALGMRWMPALVAGTLAACSPMLLAMSAEVRAYSLFALVATMALAVAATLARPRAGSRRGAWVLLATMHLALVMLHFFGAVTVVALTIAGAWVTRSDRSGGIRTPVRFSLAAMPSLAILAWWVLTVSRAAAGDTLGERASWIEEPSVGSLPQFATAAMGAFADRRLSWGVLAVFTIALVTAAWRLRTRALPRESVARTDPLLVSATTLPLLAALVASLVTGPSFWLPRYLIAVIPPLMLLLARAMMRVRRPARAGLLTLMLGWAALAGVHAIVDRRQKPDWPRLIALLARAGPAQVCVTETYVQLPLEYYALEEGLPLTVERMSRCAPTDETTWAVYRRETAAALQLLTATTAGLGPPFSLLTQRPALEARAVRWSR